MSNKKTVDLLTFDLGGIKIRGFIQGPDVWLLAIDIAKNLDGTIINHYSILSGMDKALVPVATAKGPRETLVVKPESLITWAYRSRKPIAKQLRQWIADQIKPGLLQGVIFETVKGGLDVGKVKHCGDYSGEK